MKREGRRWRAERHDASACEISWFRPTKQEARHQTGLLPDENPVPIETPQIALVRYPLGSRDDFPAFAAFPPRLYGPPEDFPPFPLERDDIWSNHSAVRSIAFRRGESRICGLRGEKCRCHRHRTRPRGVDCCGRVTAL